MSLSQRLRALPPLNPLAPNADGTPAPSPTSALADAGLSPTPPSEGTLEKLIAIARYTGVPQALGMAAEGLTRADTAWRTGILTARGQIPVEEFPQHFKDALDGKLNMSNREFNELWLSKELLKETDKISVIPRWSTIVNNPLAAFPHTVEEGEKPLLSATSLLNVGADFWASPFALLSLTPKGALKPISKLPIWSPFRTIAKGADSILFNTATKFPNPIASLLIHGREVTRALERHPNVILDLERDRDLLAKGVLEAAPKLQSALFHDQKVFGLTFRSLRKYTQLEERNVAKRMFPALQSLPGVTAPTVLTPREQSLMNELMSQVFTPRMQRGQAMGFVDKRWNPQHMLDAVIPSFVDVKSIPADIMQSWSWRTLGILDLPIKKGFAAGQKAAKATTEFAKKIERVTGQRLTDENIDLATMLKDITYAMERKLVWNARSQAVSVGTRKVATGLLDQFGNPTYTLVPMQRKRWVAEGSLLKYKPRPTTDPARQNPHVRDWSLSERDYMKSFINEIQGKARGRTALLLGEMSRRFTTQLKEGVERNRVTRYFWQEAKIGKLDVSAKQFFPRQGSYDFPEFSKPQYATKFFVHNVVRSALWGNLGAAIKNTSQLLNLATVEGLPATLKGMYKMSQPGYRRLAREEVGMEFRRLWTEESVMQHLGNRADNIFMAPFNATENFARGTAFLTYFDDWIKTVGRRHGIGSIEQAKASPYWNEAVRHAVRGSHETNFIYGVLGRPASVLGSPFLRPVTTLLTYGPKQTEFLRRAFINDGSAVLRGIGLHGWAIDFANKHAGIAAESWLGWGFIPPTRTVEGIPLATSPQIGFLLALSEGFGAHGEGRDTDAKAHFRRAAGSMGQILDTAPQLKAWISGQQDPQELLSATFDNTALKVALGGAQALGWMPFPVVAIARTMRTAIQFKSGITPSGSGETWVPITKADALKSQLFQTTDQRARFELGKLEAKARGRVDRELDARVAHFLKLAYSAGTSGDDILEAAGELAKPIRISHGLVKQPPATFVPYPEMVERRLKNQVENRTNNRDLLEMDRAGWLQDVYWSQYLTLLMRSWEAQQ